MSTRTSVHSRGADISQIAEIEKIYDNPEGTRRAIISFGRKNAKTTLAAVLLLLHLCGPLAKRNRNAQLFSAAQSRDQAAILFSLAAKIVRMSPALNAAVKVRDSTKTLLCEHYGTTYRALSAEATTAYGLSPAFIVHDELGQVVGPRSDLYDALEPAAGAQAHPLSIIISTQAERDSDLLSILIDDALAGHDPRTVVSLYSAPLDDPPFAEAMIRKANPAYGDFLNAQEVMETAKAAQRMPAREAKYRNLILNQRVVASTPFVTRAAWQACGAEVADLSGVPIYAGLDLSSVADLTAWVKIGQVDGRWNVAATFWLPSEGIHEKSRADRVPYDLWAEQALMKLTPGPTVSYEYVARFLFEEFGRFNIQKVGFDRWNMKHLKPWLLKAGFGEVQVDERFVEFGQGTLSQHPYWQMSAGNLDGDRETFTGSPLRGVAASGGAKCVRSIGRRCTADGSCATDCPAPIPSAAADACGFPWLGTADRL
jgi:phage terminase large subunit-like protein